MLIQHKLKCVEVDGIVTIYDLRFNEHFCPSSVNVTQTHTGKLLSLPICFSRIIIIIIIIITTIIIINRIIIIIIIIIKTSQIEAN